ncbi:MAG: molybdenum cofactor biosynthesis protein MoaE [Planctomycetaceae bacterium]|nr:molybdenum cofactor biosynthesis protein MoaE [Planctomycetaceae bacterium]
MIELTEQEIDFSVVTRRVQSTHAGAVLLFLGTVRDLTGDIQTASLDYEAYHSMAMQSMTDLRNQACQRFPILNAAMVHRLGHLEPGEISIAIAVSSAHRAAAFEAGQWLIDTFKQVVPIWKKENYADGRVEWVHPNAADSPASPGVTDHQMKS